MMALRFFLGLFEAGCLPLFCEFVASSTRKPSKFAYRPSFDDRPVVQEVRTAYPSRGMVLYERHQHSIRRPHFIRPVSTGF
jgi:hypothetical protein